MESAVQSRNAEGYVQGRCRGEEQTGSVGVKWVVPGDHMEGKREWAAPVSGLGDLEDGGGTLWSGDPRGMALLGDYEFILGHAGFAVHMVYI